MAKRASSPGNNGAFAALCQAAETRGWHVAIYDGPMIAVMVPGAENYSRAVQTGESFDRCAEIIHDGLRKSKVLPSGTE